MQINGKGGQFSVAEGGQFYIAANTFSKELYVFTNRRRNLLKMLFWEDNGFCLYYKRLEQHRFHWPLHMESSVITLTGQQLNWLLDGYNLKLLTPHEKLEYKTTI